MKGAVDVDVAQGPGVVVFFRHFAGGGTVGGGQAGQGGLVGGHAVEIDPDMVEMVLEKFQEGIPDGRAHDVPGTGWPSVGDDRDRGVGFVDGKPGNGPGRSAPADARIAGGWSGRLRCDPETVGRDRSHGLRRGRRRGQGRGLGPGRDCRAGGGQLRDGETRFGRRRRHGGYRGVARCHGRQGSLGRCEAGCRGRERVYRLGRGEGFGRRQRRAKDNGTLGVDRRLWGQSLFGDGGRCQGLGFGRRGDSHGPGGSGGDLGRGGPVDRRRECAGFLGRPVRGRSGSRTGRVGGAGGQEQEREKEQGTKQCRHGILRPGQWRCPVIAKAVGKGKGTSATPRRWTVPIMGRRIRNAPGWTGLRSRSGRLRTRRHPWACGWSWSGPRRR